MTMEQTCKEELESLTNTMNADKRKEIAEVKKEKDDEKKKELELYEVKSAAACKTEKDATRTAMLQQCSEETEFLQ